MLGSSADNSTIGNGFDVRCSFAEGHKAENRETTQSNIPCTIVWVICYQAPRRLHVPGALGASASHSRIR